MTIRKSYAVWKGTLKGGQGSVKLGSGAFEGQYSFSSRFEEGVGTNPEELVGAAHAGCFSMALSADLERAGFVATRVETTANVHFGRVDDKPRITRIVLQTKAEVPGIDAEQFHAIAEGAKTGCPISAALAAVEIQLEAQLIQ